MPSEASMSCSIHINIDLKSLSSHASDMLSLCWNGPWGASQWAPFSPHSGEQITSSTCSLSKDSAGFTTSQSSSLISAHMQGWSWKWPSSDNLLITLNRTDSNEDYLLIDFNTLPHNGTSLTGTEVAAPG